MIDLKASDDVGHANLSKRGRFDTNAKVSVENFGYDQVDVKEEHNGAEEKDQAGRPVYIGIPNEIEYPSHSIHQSVSMPGRSSADQAFISALKSFQFSQVPFQNSQSQKQKLSKIQSNKNGEQSNEIENQTGRTQIHTVA